MPETSTAIHLDGLNPEQLEAAEHFEGPILVLAGAGSGKTRVLTARVCNLIHRHGVGPDRILAVTFTNKAAGEMRERIGRLLGSDPAGMWVGTFHAIGARILRRHADRLGWDRTFSIFDSEQSLRLLKNVQESVGLDPKRWSPKAIRNEISNVKNQLVDAETFVADHEGSFDLFLRNVARVFPEYQKALEHQNAFDFDDLLMKPVQLFESQPELLERYRERFAFVLVDEYQDTNRAQFRFVELLAGHHENLMVVGDDDQSIYGWRGADIRNILEFEESFSTARTVRLERNYRSTERILEAANHVISENVHRKGKTLRTERSGGEPLSLVE
ncbi:MAG: UvrD-helicase domain-containing protein, partial [Gemmatimonadota bacterium]|nr:UvrD-helicase domain-containing protein [Gemmatimonadota bacterium]